MVRARAAGSGFAAVVGLLLCGAALAQGGPPRGFGAGPLGDGIGIEGFAAGPHGKTVAGSPYSANFSITSTQTLPDGNQISRNNTGSVARDTQGRTRRDITLSSIGPWAAEGKPAVHTVFINDVVAGTQYILNVDQKTARKMTWQGRGPRPNTSPRPPRPRNSDDGVTTSLGTQLINGVNAEGTRYTRTIPAGAVGNDKPIVITNEQWYSSDLQTVVMSKRSDPRMGETVFQLTNVQRTEPDPSLFQVPADFAVKEGGPRPGAVIAQP